MTTPAGLAQQLKWATDDVARLETQERTERRILQDTQWSLRDARNRMSGIQQEIEKAAQHEGT